VGTTSVVAGAPTRKQFGQGRVVYFPGIDFDGPMPPAEPYFHIGPEFWKRPKNSKELVDEVAWAAHGDLPLQVIGPDFLGANLVEQADKRRRLIHLVNYNTRNVPSIENIEVKCAIPEGKSAIAVRLYSTDLDTFKPLNYQMLGRQVVVTVPRLNAYCMVAMSW